MSERDTEDQNEPKTEESEADDPPRGLGLEAGVQRLSDQLRWLFEVSVTEPPPPSAETVAETAAAEGASNNQQRDPSSQGPRPERVHKIRAETYLLDSRFEGDAFVVIADIPGASQEDISVGINHSTYKLVIKNDGRVIERVPLPWYPVEVTRAWYNNGILDVRVRPTRS